MNRLSENVQKHLELFCERYPTLVPIKEDILNTYTILEECYKNGGKLLIAGNGGSAADAEHIVGVNITGTFTPLVRIEETIVPD